MSNDKNRKNGNDSQPSGKTQAKNRQQNLAEGKTKASGQAGKASPSEGNRQQQGGNGTDRARD